MVLNVSDATTHARARDKQQQAIVNEEVTKLCSDIDKMIEAQFDPRRPAVPMSFEVQGRFKHITEPEIVSSIMTEITALYRQAGWQVTIPAFPRPVGPERFEFRTTEAAIPAEVCGSDE